MSKLVPKELSWLSFNARVLQEAADKSVPLIERVRFLGIYSNNQDEFFKVRVADLKRQVIINKEQGLAEQSQEAARLLKQVQTAASEYQHVQNKVYRELMDELGEHNIFLKNDSEITQLQKVWVRRYFKRHVQKHINPVIISDNIDLISFLRDQYTYLLIRMSSKKESHYALIEIPVDVVPRFLRLPSEDNNITLMFLDDVIRIGLDDIFRGFFDYSKIEAYSIKMNRDAEYDLFSSADKSLIENMTDALKQRLDAMPVRFAYARDMPREMVEFMAEKLRMSEMDSLMPGNRYHNFKDFLSFPSISDDYENPSLQSVPSAAFDTAQTPFEAISRGDVLLYYPYYSFEYFTEVLRQASYDPRVTSIKINIYRVASNSRVIDSLIHAANNGKRVTVVVELKARFDEANNIKWASRLTDAGVKVLFGLPTLKIHSKLCLITRREGDATVRYAHIGTGNFNEKTAKIYTDFALFTKNPELTAEVESVFEFIEYPYTRPSFKHLLVSPLNARRRIYSMIDREIEHARTGYPAYINLKVNNLVDSGLIERLYQASQAGVQIRAIVRGMCSLRPGVPGLSENIYITSIVDRFLEHPRVMVFCNNNNPELYISSADWMTRNLDYRIEVGAPVLDPRLRERIQTIFRIQCNDNQKARIIDADQKNVYAQSDSGVSGEQIRSQIVIHDFLMDIENSQLPLPREEKIKDGKKDKEKDKENRSGRDKDKDSKDSRDKDGRDKKSAKNK